MMKYLRKPTKRRKAFYRPTASEVSVHGWLHCGKSTVRQNTRVELCGGGKLNHGSQEAEQGRFCANRFLPCTFSPPDPQPIGSHAHIQGESSPSVCHSVSQSLEIHSQTHQEDASLICSSLCLIKLIIKINHHKCILIS